MRKELLPKLTFKRTAPKNMIEEDRLLFNKEFNRETIAISVCTLRNALFINGVIIDTISGNYLAHYTQHHSFSWKQKLKLQVKKAISQTQHIKKGVIVTDDWSYGYFHWFTDVLPKISLLSDEHTFFLIPKALCQYVFIQKSLEYMKIANNVIFLDEETNYQIDDLTVFDSYYSSGNYHKPTIQKLNTIFQSREAQPTDKIYISRAKALKRKIINETEVINLLKKYNYQIHHFEDYDWDTQVHIMQKTKTLIGLHGAGLTNMLFMTPQTNVVEIRNTQDAHNNCYFSLASDLDINYYYLLARGNQADSHTVNVTVDIENLEKVLVQIEEEDKK